MCSALLSFLSKAFFLQYMYYSFKIPYLQDHFLGNILSPKNIVKKTRGFDVILVPPHVFISTPLLDTSCTCNFFPLNFAALVSLVFFYFQDLPKISVCLKRLLGLDVLKIDLYNSIFPTPNLNFPFSSFSGVFNERVSCDFVRFSFIVSCDLVFV